MTTRPEAYCMLLLWMSTLSGPVCMQNPQPKCEHAAPRPGTHYVCDSPQNPCYCHLEPDIPGSPPGEYYREEAAAGERKVWADPRHKLYYCSEKRPAKLSKKALLLSEQEAKLRGYKPARSSGCEVKQQK